MHVFGGEGRSGPVRMLLLLMAVLALVMAGCGEDEEEAGAP
jgi:hypothetical protein